MSYVHPNIIFLNTFYVPNTRYLKIINGVPKFIGPKYRFHRYTYSKKSIHLYRDV